MEFGVFAAKGRVGSGRYHGPHEFMIFSFLLLFLHYVPMHFDFVILLVLLTRRHLKYVWFGPLICRSRVVLFLAYMLIVSEWIVLTSFVASGSIYFSSQLTRRARSQKTKSRIVQHTTTRSLPPTQEPPNKKQKTDLMTLIVEFLND